MKLTMSNFQIQKEMEKLYGKGYNFMKKFGYNKKGCGARE
jgi:hypothetical protein